MEHDFSEFKNEMVPSLSSGFKDMRNELRNMLGIGGGDKSPPQLDRDGSIEAENERDETQFVSNEAFDRDSEPKETSLAQTRIKDIRRKTRTTEDGQASIAAATSSQQPIIVHCHHEEKDRKEKEKKEDKVDESNFYEESLLLSEVIRSSLNLKDYKPYMCDRMCLDLEETGPISNAPAVSWGKIFIAHEYPSEAAL